MIFGHGNDSYLYGDRIKMDFSSNLPGFANLGGLEAHLATRLSTIKSYPEPEARELEELLAEELGIQPNSIMVTAGAIEAIYLIAQLYRGWASVIPQPTFSEYEDACKIHGHLVSYYDNDDMEVLPDKRIYWLCNPNNPTGNVMLKTLMSHVIREQRNYIFVVDQSYEDYTLKSMLQPREMQDCYNLILIHSMTKKYCIPGLRRQIRQPWTVNSLAIEAGKYMVQNHVEVIPDKVKYLNDAALLHEMLSDIPRLMLMDSDTNFMLAHIEHSNAKKLKQWLIEKHGILIRDASNFHGLDHHCFRVSGQTPEQNEALVEAIKEYLKEY